MYEGGIRVPTFLRWDPKIEPGRQSENFVMLMDLFPTFCDVAKVDHPPETDGISILPTLVGDPQTTNDRIAFWMRREGGRYGGQAYYAARYREFKMLQNTPYEPFQYFNLKEDPYETNPLDPREIEIYDSLRFQLQEHIRESGQIPWQKQ